VTAETHVNVGTLWVVTETPDDPNASPLWTGEAESALDALDGFADTEGFVPYSELPDEDGTEWTGVDDKGRTWGIFTNTTVYAVPA
jgi:hypothetical protein